MTAPVNMTAPVKLNISVSGDPAAPALILAHPLGANLEVWDGLAPALAEKFRLVRFDARGHGGSRIPPGPYALADLGGDALAMMDDLGVNRAHFVGQSMGGAIGQWLMIHAPERLNKVVLANTATHFPDAAGWNGRIRAARGSGMRDLAPVILQRWLTEGFRRQDPAQAGRILHMLETTDPAGYAACCAALRDLDLRDDLRAAPSIPTLVITGESDVSTPPALGAALADALPELAAGQAQGGASLGRRAGAGFLAGGDGVPDIGRHLPGLERRAASSARPLRRRKSSVRQFAQRGADMGHGFRHLFGVHWPQDAGAGAMFVILRRRGHGMGADSAGRTLQLVGEVGALARLAGRVGNLRRNLFRLAVEQGQQFGFERPVAHGLAGEMHEVDGKGRRGAPRG